MIFYKAKNKGNLEIGLSRGAVQLAGLGAMQEKQVDCNVCMHGFFSFTMPMSDSMVALSHGEDIEPIDGRIPCSRMVLDSSSNTYWAPWMKW